MEESRDAAYEENKRKIGFPMNVLGFVGNLSNTAEKR